MKKWKNLGCYIFVLMVLFMVQACSTADTTGDVTRRTYGDIEFNNSGGGKQTITIEITGTSESATDTDITTDNDPSTTTSPRVAAGWNGSSSALSGGELLQEGISSVASTVVKKLAEPKPSPVPAPVAKPSPVIPAPVIVPTEPEPETETLVNEPVTEATTGTPVKEWFDLRSLDGNDKKFTWLPKTGSYYGKNFLFRFPGCAGILRIPDGAVTIGMDGTKQYGQAYYFCGTDFPAGSGENNGGKASVFAPPGCKANKVTIEYTK